MTETMKSLRTAIDTLSFNVNQRLSALEIITQIDTKSSKANPKDVNKLLACMKTARAEGFIPAIKAYRTLTGLGLKEAKDAIERYR